MDDDIVQITQKSSNDTSFAGKRNQAMQQTAPNQPSNKRSKASTLNVEELQGASHNPAPQSATF